MLPGSVVGTSAESPSDDVMTMMHVKRMSVFQLENLKVTVIIYERQRMVRCLAQSLRHKRSINSTQLFKLVKIQTSATISSTIYTL